MGDIWSKCRSDLTITCSLLLSCGFSLVSMTTHHGMVGWKVKDNAMPVRGREGPKGCETSRLPHCLDNRLIDGSMDVSLTRPSPPPPLEDSWYSILLRGWFDPRAIVRLEGLGQLNDINNDIGNRSCDLLACSIVPQPTTLSRAPSRMKDKMERIWREVAMARGYLGCLRNIKNCKDSRCCTWDSNWVLTNRSLER
jgi:hypothetical protein